MPELRHHLRRCHRHHLHLRGGRVGDGVLVLWGSSSPYGNSGSGALSLVSGNTWSTEVGGYHYANFTILGNEAVRYYAKVVDNHGTSVTSPTVTNTLTECDPDVPSGVPTQ